jgi:hypothetical protein
MQIEHVKACYAFHPLLKSQVVLRAEKIKISKTLIGLVATCGAQYQALNGDIAKRLATFERKF